MHLPLIFVFAVSLVDAIDSEKVSVVPYSLIQSSILCDLRNAFNGGPDTSWNCANSVCGGWTGVACSSSGAVTSISISSKSILGSLPLSLGYLSSLVNLNLGSNSINGNIPSTLGYLYSLSYLSLYANRLTGTIPFSFSSMISLVYLNVAGLSSTTRGSLLGSIPFVIGSFSALTELI